MSAAATTIISVSASTVATLVSHKRFQVAPEEEIQGIEVQEALRPSNRLSASNSPSRGRCMGVVTHRNRKLC
ncbi:hypothetical protein TNCV_1841101 [Trichonephila clavipes]|nr:hypothetical protein TNCV_1841101 [Trichonephila clavipes]